MGEGQAKAKHAEVLARIQALEEEQRSLRAAYDTLRATAERDARLYAAGLASPPPRAAPRGEALRWIIVILLIGGTLSWTTNFVAGRRIDSEVDRAVRSL